MTDKSIRMIATRGGMARRLLTFTEKKDDTVIVAIINCKNDGTWNYDNKMEVRRFSLHSTKDKPYSTVKYTGKSKHGPEKNVWNKIISIKQKTGFNLIFTSRFTDLASEIYDIKKRKSDDAINIGAVEDGETLFMALYVGSKNSYFPKKILNAKIIQLEFKEIKIICVFLTICIPAGAYSRMQIFSKPQEDNIIGLQKIYPSIFEVDSAPTYEPCIQMFNNSIKELLIDRFETELLIEKNSANDKEHIEWLEEFLYRIENSNPMTDYCLYEPDNWTVKKLHPYKSFHFLKKVTYSGILFK